MTNNYIKNFRKRFGWSQKRLAEQSGISHSAIKSWEQEKTVPPRWVELVFSAIAFNLPPYQDNDN